MLWSLTRPVRGRCLSRLLLLGIGALGLLWVLFVVLRIELAGRRDDAVSSDAIVVLGAAQYNGTPSPVFRARLDHALGLYEAGKAPLVIVAGGKQDGDAYTEASAGVAYLQKRGVSADALLPVGAGNNTLASMRAVNETLGRKKLSSVVLVSDRFHMLRSLQMASDLGIVAHGSPTTTSPIQNKLASRLRHTLREVGAYTSYMLLES